MENLFYYSWNLYLDMLEGWLQAVANGLFYFKIDPVIYKEPNYPGFYKTKLLMDPPPYNPNLSFGP